MVHEAAVPKGDPVTLRAAQRADASSLAALSLEVWLGTYISNGINAFFADYALAQFTAGGFERLLGDARETLIVSDNVEGIDGYVRLARDRAAAVPGCSPVEIVTLYVQPRHQGRGIGGALLDAALERCRAEGVGRPWLAVNSENGAAIAFYAARGFVKIGTTFFEIDGERYPNEILAIDLNGWAPQGRRGLTPAAPPCPDSSARPDPEPP